MDIRSVSGLGFNNFGTKSVSSAAVSGDTFENILSETMNTANETSKLNDNDTLKLIGGDVNDLHTSMIEMEKSELALQFTIQIRNKILDAYNEIMRMQI